MALVPGGISSKASEYKELGRKGERWESPVFSIGTAARSRDLPAAPRVTRKVAPHSVTSSNRIVDAYQRSLPFYYVHAGGVQANYIDLKNAWNVFFKYEHEYSARAHPQGTTIVFGAVYTFRIPKPTPAQAKP